MSKRITYAATAFATAASISLGAMAADVKLPKNLAWTAYGTTSSGYAQSIGLGNMLKKNYGTELRVIPGKNDVSRMLPLRAKQAQICACGIAAYFGQEGVLMFANKNWGPTRLYNLFNNIGRNGTGLVFAGDAGINTPADLKGKRVTWVKGAPALNVNATAVLAFGGLTWDDVVKVEVPGWGQSMQAILDGQADAAFGSTISSIYAQIAASPRGIFHPAFPHDDTAGWKRVHDVTPYWSKVMVSNAVGGENNSTGKMPYPGAGYPYPIFVSMPDLDNDTAYGLTKAVMEKYEDFKESGPGMDGYQIQNQNLQWVFPYHPGSVAYFKEVGKWTAEDQAHNDALLKRQDLLAGAWKKFMATKPSNETFEVDWLKARAAALDANGMGVPFRNPM
jgi:TRAP transporter TAXI family solute receptor